MYRRSTAIVACLMAEALDVQGIHMLPKVPNNATIIRKDKDDFYFNAKFICRAVTGD